MCLVRFWFIVGYLNFFHKIYLLIWRNPRKSFHWGFRSNSHQIQTLLFHFRPQSEKKENAAEGSRRHRLRLQCCIRQIPIRTPKQ